MRKFFITTVLSTLWGLFLVVRCSLVSAGVPAALPEPDSIAAKHAGMCKNRLQLLTSYEPVGIPFNFNLTESEMVSKVKSYAGTNCVTDPFRLIMDFGETTVEPRCVVYDYKCSSQEQKLRVIDVLINFAGAFMIDMEYADSEDFNENVLHIAELCLKHWSYDNDRYDRNRDIGFHILGPNAEKRKIVAAMAMEGYLHAVNSICMRDFGVPLCEMNRAALQLVNHPFSFVLFGEGAPPPPPPPPPPSETTDSDNEPTFNGLLKDVPSSTGATAQKVYTLVDEMPKYPGGDGELLNYIAKNLEYPSTAKENGIQGAVYVSYVVEVDGSVNDVEVVRGADPILDSAAIDVVKSLRGYTPGRYKGKPVRVQFTLPIRFALN